MIIEVISNIKTVLSNGKGGYTSIYTDLKNANRTEVDTIAGSVVAAAKEYGVSVPCHEMAVALYTLWKIKISSNKELKMCVLI